MRDDGQTFHETRTPAGGQGKTASATRVGARTITLLYILETQYLVLRLVGKAALILAPAARTLSCDTYLTRRFRSPQRLRCCALDWVWQELEKGVGIDGGRVERRTIAWRRVSGRRVE